MSDSTLLLSKLSSEVHVWAAFPNQIQSQHAINAYERVLSEDELTRYKSFHFERDRHIYLVAHALLRNTLSRYTGIPPQSCEFENNAYGKPEIANMNELNLHFNLSHTNGMVACIVTQGMKCGIDVELVRNIGDLEIIARESFSPEEFAHLDLLAGSEKKEIFYKYWTLKEAYAKAKGIGLSLPFNHISFHFNSSGEILITSPDETTQSARSWQFYFFNPSIDHALALSFQRNRIPAYRIIYHSITP